MGAEGGNVHVVGLHVESDSKHINLHSQGISVTFSMKPLATKCTRAG